ncbi:hypothetical protein T05_2645 [Trichinella murrelli]|uniref:Uncharacterized protein n=1 Tax=Trichinella murrelli TaxID=144512 RepID=A0A0V0TSA3_9BILA|nr:hypothetical protein T05_2645 [Trichinella murrelli]
MAGYIKPQYKLRLLVKSTTFRVIMQKKAPDGSRSPVLQPKSGPPYICVVLTQWDYLLFDYIFSSDTQRFKPFHARLRFCWLLCRCIVTFIFIVCACLLIFFVTSEPVTGGRSEPPVGAAGPSSIYLATNARRGIIMSIIRGSYRSSSKSLSLE